MDKSQAFPFSGIGGDRPRLFPLPLSPALEPGVETAFDRALMARCLVLAQRSAGQTAPNPMVGAVVVQAQQVVGEGFHPGAGQPHAEVFALKAAGEQARGATLYVNLEPCNHHGRTPPCTQALLQAGVGRVVVGMVDPDPRVSGRGIDRLRAAGIDVVVGVEETACQVLNEAFVHRVRYQQPFGILKYAMTLDGKIATTTGHSAWVTSPVARQAVHHLRASADAVIVGGNTVRQDNPHLTTHEVAPHNPLRVVLSPSLDLPTQAHLWDTTVAPTLIATRSGTQPELQQHLQNQGVEVLNLDPCTPDQIMDHLYQQGCATVLWECGGTLAAKAITAGAIQKVIAFVAPKIIGGREAPSPVGDLGLHQMSAALVLEQTQGRSLGPDWVVEGYLRQGLG